MKHLLAMIPLVLATPSLAAVPQLVPSRDVTVNYTVHSKDSRLQEVRVSIAAGGRHLRVSTQDVPFVFLVDRDLGRATIVVPLLRGYTSVDIARYDPERTILRGARFAQRGAHVVAGLPCTDWHAVSASGTADACITADGIILRGSASDRHGPLGSTVASSVAYGGLDGSTFEPPGDYKFVDDLPFGVFGIRP